MAVTLRTVSSRAVQLHADHEYTYEQMLCHLRRLRDGKRMQCQFLASKQRPIFTRQHVRVEVEGEVVCTVPPDADERNLSIVATAACRMHNSAVRARGINTLAVVRDTCAMEIDSALDACLWDEVAQLEQMQCRLGETSEDMDDTGTFDDSDDTKTLEDSDDQLLDSDNTLEP
jgi:hypothetical protein